MSVNKMKMHEKAFFLNSCFVKLTSLCNELLLIDGMAQSELHHIMSCYLPVKKPEKRRHSKKANQIWKTD
jgi:hypothetical protein